MSDRVGAPGGGDNRTNALYRDEGDGTHSEQLSTNLRAWDADPGVLAWIKLAVDHATGALKVYTVNAGGGGGGAATIADGADVTQGAIADAAWSGSGSGTVVAILKAIWTRLRGGQTTMANSLPVAIASDQSELTAKQGTPAAAAAPWLFRASDGAAVYNPASDTVLQAVRDRLPAALDADGGLKVHAQSAVPVTDNGGSLTVDAPVGTPVFSRLSDGAAALIGQKAMAASLPVTVASDQGSVPTVPQVSGATNVLKTGTLTTTAVTADQVVLTYTVTAAKTFYLCYLVMYGRLTVLAATATILGAISLETPSGTKVLTLDDVNPTTSELEFNPLILSVPIPVAAGVVVRVVVTPAAATSMLWRANFGGFEK